MKKLIALLLISCSTFAYGSTKHGLDSDKYAEVWQEIFSCQFTQAKIRLSSICPNSVEEIIHQQFVLCYIEYKEDQSSTEDRMFDDVEDMAMAEYEDIN